MYGYGDDQRLQYPVERDPLNIVQALLFGNSGLSESRDFYASGDTGLSAKQTQILKEMGEGGADRRKVYDAIQTVRGGTTTEEKLQALSEAALSDEEKLQLYESLIASSGSRKPGDLRTLMEAGIRCEQVSPERAMRLAEMQKEYEKLMQEYQANQSTYTDLTRTAKEQAIQQLIERIQTFQNLAQQEMAKAQERLLQPIMEKANKAIQEVGKENGFTYIFDLSNGAVLYVAENAIDVLPLVKKKLGIQ